MLLIGVTDDGTTKINEIGGGFIGGDYGWSLINGAMARHLSGTGDPAS
ncbi:hypothetical protein [Streptomyces adustus]